MRSRRPTSAGFTLVELGAVVAIVSILALVAVVGYRKYTLHAKVSEAQSMIGAIRIAQEDYRAERGTYANLGTTYCPTGAGVSDKLFEWTPTCSGGTLPWTTLPVHASGPVRFAYATVAGGAWSEPPGTSWIAWNSPTAPLWYVVMATCDLDPSGTEQTMLVGSSFQNSIFSKDVGE